MAQGNSSEAEVLLIGGQIASGKTALANSLVDSAPCELIRVRQALQQVLGGAKWDRQRLQREGAALDARTRGRWLLAYLREQTELGGRWVVDAVRTRRQVEPVLDNLTGSKLVYLRAHESTRRQRYTRGQATDPVKRSVSFDEAMRHSTEQGVHVLAEMAHLVIDTDDLTLEEMCGSVRRWTGW
jgi:predicted kinase